MLSHRQEQVLELPADGLSDKEIALHLGIAAKPVEFHKQKVLGVPGISEQSHT
jgi:DNA-binding NarL/FixJ family response regulator